MIHGQSIGEEDEEVKDSLISPALKLQFSGKRVYTTEERVWQAIAGHAVDHNRIPRFEFECLSLIAAYGPAGVLQPHVVHVSGQDKRSVPKRTDALAEKGYIFKESVIGAGTKTSLLKLKRYTSVQTLSQPKLPRLRAGLNPKKDLRPVISYDSWFDQVVAKLKEKNSLLAVRDLLFHLGVEPTTWTSKIIFRCLRRLDGSGLLRRVRARPYGRDPAAKDIKIRAIKLLREPTEVDRAAFKANDWSGRGPDILGWEDDEDDVVVVENTENIEEDGEIIAIDEGVSDREEDVKGADVEEEPPQLENKEHIRPQWSPDLPINNVVFNIIDGSGLAGIDAVQLTSTATGPFCQSSLEEVLDRLVESGARSQPAHLKHMAITRTLNTSSKRPTYRYRSLANFEKAVAAGMVPSYTQPIAEADSSTGQLDEWGFPVIESSLFMGRNGQSTLQDAIEQSNGKRKRATSANDDILEPDLEDNDINLDGETPSKRKTRGKRVRVDFHEEGAVLDNGDESQARRRRPGRPPKRSTGSTPGRKRRRADSGDEVPTPGNKQSRNDSTAAPTAASPAEQTTPRVRGKYSRPEVPVVKKRKITDEEREKYEQAVQETAERRAKAEIKLSRKKLAAAAGNSLTDPPEEQDVQEEDVPQNRVAQIKADILAQTKPGVYIDPPEACKAKVENFIRRGRPRKSLLAVIKTPLLEGLPWFEDDSGPRYAPIRKRWQKKEPQAEDEQATNSGTSAPSVQDNAQADRPVDTAQAVPVSQDAQSLKGPPLATMPFPTLSEPAAQPDTTTRSSLSEAQLSTADPTSQVHQQQPAEQLSESARVFPTPQPPQPSQPLQSSQPTQFWQPSNSWQPSHPSQSPQPSQLSQPSNSWHPSYIHPPQPHIGNLGPHAGNNAVTAKNMSTAEMAALSENSYSMKQQSKFPKMPGAYGRMRLGAGPSPTANSSQTNSTASIEQQSMFGLLRPTPDSRSLYEQRRSFSGHGSGNQAAGAEMPQAPRQDRPQQPVQSAAPVRSSATMMPEAPAPPVPNGGFFGVPANRMPGYNPSHYNPSQSGTFPGLEIPVPGPLVSESSTTASQSRSSVLQSWPSASFEYPVAASDMPNTESAAEMSRTSSPSSAGYAPFTPLKSPVTSAKQQLKAIRSRRGRKSAAQMSRIAELEDIIASGDGQGANALASPPDETIPSELAEEAKQLMALRSKPGRKSATHWEKIAELEAIIASKHARMANAPESPEARESLVVKLPIPQSNPQVASQRQTADALRLTPTPMTSQPSQNARQQPNLSQVHPQDLASGHQATERELSQSSTGTGINLQTQTQTNAASGTAVNHERVPTASGEKVTAGDKEALVVRLPMSGARTTAQAFGENSATTNRQKASELSMNAATPRSRHEAMATEPATASSVLSIVRPYGIDASLPSTPNRPRQQSLTSLDTTMTPKEASVIQEAQLNGFRSQQAPASFEPSPALEEDPMDVDTPDSTRQTLTRPPSSARNGTAKPRTARAKGSAADERQTILVDAVRSCNGCFPGNEEPWCVLATAWKRLYGEDLDRNTADTVVRNSVDCKKLKKMTFQFKTSSGLLVKRLVLLDPAINPYDGKVTELRKKIISCFPSPFFPAGVEISEEMLTAVGGTRGPMEQIASSSKVWSRRSARRSSTGLNGRGATRQKQPTARQSLVDDTDDDEDEDEEVSPEQAAMQGEIQLDNYQHDPTAMPPKSRVGQKLAKLVQLDGHLKKTKTFSATQSYVTPRKTRQSRDVDGDVAIEVSETRVPSAALLLRPGQTFHESSGTFGTNGVLKGAPPAESKRLRNRAVRLDGIKHGYGTSMRQKILPESDTSSPSMKSRLLHQRETAVLQQLREVVNTQDELARLEKGDVEIRKLLSNRHRQRAWQATQHELEKDQQAPSYRRRTSKLDDDDSDEFVPSGAEEGQEQDSHESDEDFSDDEDAGTTKRGSAATQTKTAKRRPTSQAKATNNVLARSDTRKTQYKTRTKRNPTAVQDLEETDVEYVPGTAPLRETSNREIAQRDRKSAAEFKDVRRLIAAIALVTLVCGGVNQSLISWNIVSHALSFRWDSDFLRRRWAVLRKQNGVEVARLREALREPFLTAYQRDDLPRIDFQNLTKTDWPALLEWTEHIKSLQKSAEDTNVVSELPSRDELIEEFEVEERFPVFELSRNDFFVVQTDLGRRHLAFRYNSGNMLPGHEKPGEEAQPDMVLRSWARAIALTKQWNYNSATATQKLQNAFRPSDVERVNRAMAEAHVLARSHKGILPGRNFEIHNDVLAQFRRWPAKPDEHTYLRHVAGAWTHVMRHLKSNDQLHLIPAASDPEYVVLTNMIAEGLLKVCVHLPERNNDFDAEPPKLSPWSYGDYSYETKRVNPAVLKFPIVYVKTDKFSTEHGLDPDVPLPVEASLVEGEEGARIPFWVDIHGNILDDAWDMVLRSILHLLVFRPGSTAMSMEKAHERKLWAWEIELALQWMGRVGIAAQCEAGGWRAGAKWYCAFLPEITKQWKAPQGSELVTYA